MKFLDKLGLYAIELINEQVEQGIDSDGNSYKYSTKPFARPAGNLDKYKKAIKDGKLNTFKTKNGKLWFMVLGGYKSWREINGRSPNGDFLQWSGQMLRSLYPRATDSEVAIMFSDAESAQKAFWLNVSGAGKSRKLWKFLGLTDSNEKRLADYAESLFASDDNIWNLLNL